MRIILITFCYNEEIILPYFLKHYNFCEKIIVHYSNSTDNSFKLLQECKNVSIILDKGDYIDDLEHTNIRNNDYKAYRDFDWAITCDIDEFLYHPNLLQKLEEYKHEGITIPLTTGFDMYSEKIPIEDKPIYDIINTGKENSKYYSKKIIFNPNVEINYNIGAHEAHPSGIVKYTKLAELKLLHYKYLSYDYMIQKAHSSLQRQSEANKKNKWGVHNYDIIKITKEQYQENLKNTGRVI